MSRIINFRRHFDSIIEGLVQIPTTQFFCAQNLEVIPNSASAISKRKSATAAIGQTF